MILCKGLPLPQRKRGRNAKGDSWNSSFQGLVRQDVFDRGAGFGDSSVVIFAEEGSQRGRDLVLMNLLDVAALSQRSGVRAKDSDPNILSTFNVRPVISPFVGAASASMIAGENEGGFVAIFRH